MRKLVLVTGGFDPLHKGHIAYLQAAFKLGDGLVVGLNSDAWLQRKKGKHFLDFEDRKAVLDALWMVDEVITFDDADDSARAAIQFCLDNTTAERIVFANGGDRNGSNIPEMDVVSDRLDFVFGVGGDDKLNSSSLILQRWANE
jgi:D-beta-D-heptose 7-phosphate kinase/D-beta-D-heptose 1-phosphate adenosyltransferase